jgi:predicted nucleotide-binding protein
MTPSSGASGRLPVLFVGSAVEDIPVAEAIQVQLDYVAEVELWREGTFVPSGFALASLLDSARRVDFALMIASPVDSTVTRGTNRPVARDNVIFELGLFAGVLGRERSFLLTPRGTDLRLPTDLGGMTPLDWDPRKLNMESAVGAACTRLKAAMSSLGLRSTP